MRDRRKAYTARDKIARDTSNVSYDLTKWCLSIYAMTQTL